MLMLDGSSLAGVVAPLPLWPRKPTPLDQLQPLETRMSFFSDDDVVVYRDPQGLCDFHNDPRHFNIGAGRDRPPRHDDGTADAAPAQQGDR
jgi:hypothetical protein